MLWPRPVKANRVALDGGERMSLFRDIMRPVLRIEKKIIFFAALNMNAGVKQDLERQKWDEMRHGDSAALSWLYDRYFGLLFNYGRKIGMKSGSVEDAIHDVFVDLWRFRENLSPTTSVRFYLYRALRRRLLRNNTEKDYLMVDATMADGLIHQVPCYEQLIIEREVGIERVDKLKKLLNDLSPRQYEAMILRFYDELTFPEIAGILNVNEQSARNLVQRGLIQLKQYARHIIVLLPFLLMW